MYSVQFNNINDTDLDLVTLSVGRRQRAQEQIIDEPIPYSNNNYVEHTGKYLPYERSMEFYVADEEKINLINDWLKGYARLRTGKDIGGYFKAHVISGLEYDKFLQVKDRFKVDFKINPPFFYLDSGDNPIVLTSAQTINNPGTHTSDPMMRIMGNGNATVSINGRIMVFQNIETFLDIDPDIIPAVYKNNENVGEKMVGDLPYLDPGLNEITWSGNIEQINILPRWRNL